MDEKTREKIADALHEVTDAEMLDAIEHFLTVIQIRKSEAKWESPKQSY